MSDLTSLLANSSPFDEMRRARPDGSEFWSARELMAPYGYSKWQDFTNAIERAKISAANTGVDVPTAFVQVEMPRMPERVARERVSAQFEVAR